MSHAVQALVSRPVLWSRTVPLASWRAVGCRSRQASGASPSHCVRPTRPPRRPRCSTGSITRRNSSFSPVTTKPTWVLAPPPTSLRVCVCVCVVTFLAQNGPLGGLAVHFGKSWMMKAGRIFILGYHSSLFCWWFSFGRGAKNLRLMWKLRPTAEITSITSQQLKPYALTAP